MPTTMYFTYLWLSNTPCGKDSVETSLVKMKSWRAGRSRRGGAAGAARPLRLRSFSCVVARGGEPNFVSTREPHKSQSFEQTTYCTRYCLLLYNSTARPRLSSQEMRPRSAAMAGRLASRDNRSEAPLGVRRTVCTRHCGTMHRWLSTAHPSSDSTAHSTAHSVTRAGCCCCGGCCGCCAGRRGALDTSETVVYLVRVRVGLGVGLGLGMLP